MKRASRSASAALMGKQSRWNRAERQATLPALPHKSATPVLSLGRTAAGQHPARETQASNLASLSRKSTGPNAESVLRVPGILAKIPEQPLKPLHDPSSILSRQVNCPFEDCFEQPAWWSLLRQCPISAVSCASGSMKPEKTQLRIYIGQISL